MGRSFEYEEFKAVIVENVQRRLGKQVVIEINKVVKNNSLEFDSMVIRESGRKCSPNFYLNLLYKEYLDGSDIECIVDTVIEQYRKPEPEGIEDITFEFDKCSDKIICRLVSKERNKSMLDMIPYIPFLDMVITFHYIVIDDASGLGSVRVTNAMLDMWGVTTKNLYNIAIQNTMRMFPKVFCSMKSMLGSMLNDDEKELLPEGIFEDENNGEPYVLTNLKGINGAAVMVYPGCMDEISNMIGGDFYILPSSIHEVLIVADDGMLSASELINMVCDVNEKCVLPDEILSDGVYRYSVEKGKVELCEVVAEK